MATAWRMVWLAGETGPGFQVASGDAVGGSLAGRLPAAPGVESRAEDNTAVSDLELAAFLAFCCWRRGARR
jgi:hypothetical protein